MGRAERPPGRGSSVEAACGRLGRRRSLGSRPGPRRRRRNPGGAPVDLIAAGRSRARRRPGKVRGAFGRVRLALRRRGRPLRRSLFGRRFLRRRFLRRPLLGCGFLGRRLFRGRLFGCRFLSRQSFRFGSLRGKMLFEAFQTVLLRAPVLDLRIAPIEEALALQPPIEERALPNIGFEARDAVGFRARSPGSRARPQGLRRRPAASARRARPRPSPSRLGPAPTRTSVRSPERRARAASRAPGGRGRSSRSASRRRAEGGRRSGRP